MKCVLLAWSLMNIFWSRESSEDDHFLNASPFTAAADLHPCRMQRKSLLWWRFDYRDQWCLIAGYCYRVLGTLCDVLGAKVLSGKR